MRGDEAFQDHRVLAGERSGWLQAVAWEFVLSHVSEARHVAPSVSSARNRNCISEHLYLGLSLALLDCPMAMKGASVGGASSLMGLHLVWSGESHVLGFRRSAATYAGR